VVSDSDPIFEREKQMGWTHPVRSVCDASLSFPRIIRT
jgi:hypothetical protein